MPIAVLFLLLVNTKMHSKPNIYFLFFSAWHDVFWSSTVSSASTPPLCFLYVLLRLCFAFPTDGEISYFLYLCRNLQVVVFSELSRTFSNCLVQEMCSDRQFFSYISVHTSQRTQSTFILKPSRIKVSTSSCKVSFLSDFNQSCDVSTKFAYRTVR